MSKQLGVVLDYRNADAANSLLPRPSILASSGWSDLHLELFEEPKFEIAEHQHTLHVIACGLSGGATGERWLDGTMERERRHVGDIAIIPAGISHRCNWNITAEFMVLAIEPALLQQVGQDIVNGDRIELMPQFMSQQDVLMQGIFATLREELEFGKLGGNLLVDSLKTTLAIHLLRNYCVTQPKLSSYSDGLSKSALRKVTDYIHHHLYQDLKLTDLSAIAQISPYHFLRLFKQQMGITPHQYILQCRIEKAKHLLQHSTMSISEIAMQTGFCDQSHLTRCFKRAVGATPKQLLRSHHSTL